MLALTNEHQKALMTHIVEVKSVFVKLATEFGYWLPL